MTTSVPRLALGKTRQIRNAEKHLKAVDDWAAGFAGYFPQPGNAYTPCSHWHVPVDQRLVDPPGARPENQRRVLQAMIHAAGHLAAARPANRTKEKIYVLTRWPEMFMAEVGVFLDPAYGKRFERRSHRYQTWTPLDRRHRSLVRELGLVLPQGWTERGYQERQEEPDDAEPGGCRISEGEIWMIGEPIARR
jgi:hypothetical protein